MEEEVHPAQVVLREVLDGLLDWAGADRPLPISAVLYRRALELSRPKQDEKMAQKWVPYVNVTIVDNEIGFVNQVGFEGKIDLSAEELTQKTVATLIGADPKTRFEFKYEEHFVEFDSGPHAKYRTLIWNFRDRQTMPVYFLLEQGSESVTDE